VEWAQGRVLVQVQAWELPLCIYTMWVGSLVVRSCTYTELHHATRPKPMER
jgi:hypothetical protein